MTLFLASLFAFAFGCQEVSATLARASTSPGLGPGAGPWESVKPEAVGLRTHDLKAANDFINSNVLDRQCFLLIKDGKIAYEWYDPTAPDPPNSPPWTGPPEGKPHRGFSMTKTLGGFLVLFAATQGDVDIDVDITTQYGVPSPKPYGVTLRMMMSQVIGGDHRPGELWRYDELGDMWLHLFPKVILAATKRNASHYWDSMHTKLGLSKNFTWDSVNSQWYRGASGSCRDWARFGQLILNGGTWADEQLIAAKYIAQMQEPVKYAPYNDYSNPCYGLLLWVNADKAKHPGCCWEASRLPNPKCNNETFMTGAVNDLTLNIGLYGQIVMTLQSVNTVVVGFGRDLRPIEPARIAYYPGVCKALGLPCNTPPEVPKTKCGELLQCTGVAAQCFSGGSWSHKEPYPGREQCVRCFQNRLPLYEAKFPEAHQMVKNWCPQTEKAAFDFVRCYCGLTSENANPFAPWPTTTTTTLPLGPPVPPPPYHPTPAPPSPGPPCELSKRCIEGLDAHWKCYNIKRNGGHACYKGIHLWQKQLTWEYGCPQFLDKQQPIYESKAFCWCGLDNSPSLNSWFSPSPSPNLLGLPDYSSLSSSSQMSSDAWSTSVFSSALVKGGLCNNGYDKKILRHKPKWLLERDTYYCGQQSEGDQDKGAACMQRAEHITPPCAHCFGMSIACSYQHCEQECACSPPPPQESPECHICVERQCKPLLHWCTGLPVSNADSADPRDRYSSNFFTV